MNNRDDEIKLAESISCMESLHGTLNDRDNDCLRIVLDAALASQAQQDHIGDANKMAKPELAKHQSCGCVICTCEHETQCQGCGAKHCGTHDVGDIPNPAYLQSQLSSNPLQLQSQAQQEPTAWIVRERSKRTGLLSNEILVGNKNYFRESEHFKYEFVPLYTIPPAPEGDKP